MSWACCCCCVVWSAIIVDVHVMFGFFLNLKEMNFLFVILQVLCVSHFSQVMQKSDWFIYLCEENHH